MKVAINVCYGGFGISDAAYEQLIAWGVPVRKYVEQQPDETTGLYKHQPANDGEVIFDRELTPMGESVFNDLYHKYKSVSQRYWDTWTSESRTHPLVIRLIEEMGEQANGRFAKLRIVEIPDGTEYAVEEYDGFEHVAEAHTTWR